MQKNVEQDFRKRKVIRLMGWHCLYIFILFSVFLFGFLYVICHAIYTNHIRVAQYHFKDVMFNT